MAEPLHLDIVDRDVFPIFMYNTPAASTARNVGRHGTIEKIVSIIKATENHGRSVEILILMRIST